MIDEQMNKLRVKLNVLLNENGYNSDNLFYLKLHDNHYQIIECDIADKEYIVADIFINYSNDVVFILNELNLCYILKVACFETSLIDVFSLNCYHGYVEILKDFLHSKVWDINVVIELLKCIQNRA